MRFSYSKHAILGLVEDSIGLYTVDEIHKKLEKEIPNISLMTVYRNIKKLTKEGKLIPIHINKTVHYCGNNNVHYHKHCIVCGLVEDVYHEKLNSVIQKFKSNTFKPFVNGIVTKGICLKCNQKTQTLPNDVGYRYGFVKK